MAIKVTNVTGQALLNPSVSIRFVTSEFQMAQETARRALIVSNVNLQALVPLTPAIGRSIGGNDDGATFPLIHGVQDFLVIDDRSPATNHLGITQSVFSPTFPVVVQDVGFVSEAISHLLNGDAVSGWAFRHSVEACLGFPWVNQEVTSVFDLDWSAGIAWEVSPSNALNLVSEGFKADAALSYLNLSQSAVASVSLVATSSFNMVGTIVTESAFLQDLTQDVGLQQASAYYIDGGCNTVTGNEFEGAGPNTDTLEKRGLTYDADFVVQSVTIADDNVTLRSPEVDNRDRLGFNRINRESRGGELGVFTDPIWSKVNTLLFTIVASKRQSIVDFQTFILDTLGKELVLQDWLGISWRGIITTPSDSFTEDSDKYWTTTFEFEGVMLPGAFCINTLDMLSEVDVLVDFLKAGDHDTAWVQEVIAGGDIYSQDGGSGFAIAFTDASSVTLSSSEILASFPGGDVTLDGTTASTGQTWVANDSFRANGINANGTRSGAYLPFVPIQSSEYECIWNVRDLHEKVLYEHSFGGAGAALHGVTPDVSSTADTFHSASTFLDNGNFTSDPLGSSGCYLPFVPVDGREYVLEAQISALDTTGEVVLPLRMFFGEDVSSPFDDRGDDASGILDPTTLKAGQELGSEAGDNYYVLGTAGDGNDTKVVYSDPTLRAANTAIHIKIHLNTEAGAGGWTATMYARDPADSAWTDISGTVTLLEETIGAIGFSTGTSTSGTLDYVKLYEDTSTTGSSNRESRFFLGKSVPALGESGVNYDGTAGESTLRAGFVLRELSGVASHAVRLGAGGDGLADTNSFLALVDQPRDIDLKILLDTRFGPGNWEVSFYARDPAVGLWQLVGAKVPVLDEDIGCIGMSNDNTSTRFDINMIKVTRETTT